MANIRLDVCEAIFDGMSVTFKAPCACSAITGLKVYYPADVVTAKSIEDMEGTDGDDGGEGTEEVENSIITESKVFTFKDANGNTLTGLGNLFEAGAYVKVVLDTENGFAYILNADTNAYLERRLKVRSATLLASYWSSDAPYSQTINVGDITSSDQPIISAGTPASPSSAAYKALTKAYSMIDRAVTSNGTITFYCYTKKPTTDIPILIKGA